MPWGDHNKGQQGPWGRPPSGPGRQAPDFEALLKNGKERFRRFLSGGAGGNNPRTLLIALLVLLFLWLSTGLYKVEPEEEGVVLRFGAFHRVAASGLNYHLPVPVERVIKIPVTTINRTEIGARTSHRGPIKIDAESLMLTGDENIVDVSFEVQWKIKDAGKYLFNLRDQMETVKSVAESAMREVVGRNPITHALTERRYEIAQEAKGIIQHVLDEYGAGVEIVDVPLRDAQPPTQVIDAFRDVQTARADQERARNEAEAYRNDIIPRARGEAEKILQEAEGYKQSVVAKAQGEASRFTQVLEEYRKARDVTRRRMYLETMEQILANMEKILVDNKGGGAGVVPYLALPELSKRMQAQEKE